MLQQTTVRAVEPFYIRFMQKFPTLKSLAEAQEVEVLENWAGLGYYTRARNLLKAAKILNHEADFPKTYIELLKLPGFGPYISRAVASLAFNEVVGVVDGNVIRVLSRLMNNQSPWWNSEGKVFFQTASDQLAQAGVKNNCSTNITNQALMELGALICTPKNPVCSICPWIKLCKARQTKSIDLCPKQKPRVAKEEVIWNVSFMQKGSQILLVKNNYLPFLKGQWIFPGERLKAEPAKTGPIFKHAITKYEIKTFINKKNQMSELKNLKKVSTSYQWVEIKNLSQVNPSSLLQKVVQKIGAGILSLLIFTSIATHLHNAEAKKSGVIESKHLEDKPTIFKIDGAEQITNLGWNSSPSLSLDGKSLLYISSKRSAHSQPQVYTLDLENLTTKRLSFSDGNIIQAIYLNPTKIITVSDSESVKEQPMKPQHFDVQVSDLNFYDVRRLTTSDYNEDRVSLLSSKDIVIREKVLDDKWSWYRFSLIRNHITQKISLEEQLIQGVVPVDENSTLLYTTDGLYFFEKRKLKYFWKQKVTSLHKTSAGTAMVANDVAASKHEQFKINLSDGCLQKINGPIEKSSIKVAEVLLINDQSLVFVGEDSAKSVSQLYRTGYSLGECTKSETSLPNYKLKY